MDRTEKQIAHLYPTTPLADIADEVGLPVFRVLMIAQRLGLKREPIKAKSSSPGRRGRSPRAPRTRKLTLEEKAAAREKREESEARKARQEFIKNPMAQMSMETKLLFCSRFSNTEPHQPCTFFVDAQKESGRQPARDNAGS